MCMAAAGTQVQTCDASSDQHLQAPLGSIGADQGINRMQNGAGCNGVLAACNCFARKGRAKAVRSKGPGKKRIRRADLDLCNDVADLAAHVGVGDGHLRLVDVHLDLGVQQVRHRHQHLADVHLRAHACT